MATIQQMTETYFKLRASLKSARSQADQFDVQTELRLGDGFDRHARAARLRGKAKALGVQLGFLQEELKRHGHWPPTRIEYDPR